MANNYTETSFMIPCTQAQATMACWWLGMLEEFDEKVKHVVESDDDTVFEYMWEQAVQQLRNMSEGREEWLAGDFYAGFQYSAESDGIWICSDESFDSDSCDLFIATVLDMYNSDELVCYSAADTCSKKRVGEFGGFAVAVSRQGVENSIGTWGWMEQQKEAFKTGNMKVD